MDASASRRRSRWDRAPALDSQGRLRRAQLTERDIEIFKLLARYRYMSIDDIHAFVGGSRKGLAHHVNLLCRAPNLYLNRPQQQRQSADANHRPLIYELDRRGITVLRELDLPVGPRHCHRNFAHEVMVDRIMASFELGIRTTAELRLVDWDHIIASGKVPVSTIQSPRPTHIPTTIVMRDREHRIEINADGKPFGIEYRVQSATLVYRFFPGIEADMGTEPLQTLDVERSSIVKKLLAYLSIERTGTYCCHFGFPNLFVPFVTTSATRVQSMMEALARITEGRGSKFILFKAWPNPGAASALPPLGHILTEPWQRVGFPDLWLDR